MKRTPKAAVFNDLTGYGRCSLTVAIPTLTNMGVCCCPAPTAILSNHTGFERFFMVDFTDNLQGYIDGWREQNIRFDCVYTGFLGSERQTTILEPYLEECRRAGALLVVDPVMGDQGALYQCYTEEMIRGMRRLIAQADIITPNFTEACFLLGREYEDTVSDEKMRDYLRQLADMGPATVCITGVAQDDGNANWGYDRATGEYVKSPFSMLPVHYSGTGDFFCSLLVGYVLHGKPLSWSLKRIGELITKAVSMTYEMGTPILEGVLLEPLFQEETLLKLPR